MIHKIQPCYNFSKINFKGKRKETKSNYFDDEYKKFSAMQKNYYAYDFSTKEHLNVVFPVNGNVGNCFHILLQNVKELGSKERILACSCPKYTTDEVICSDKGYTDGIVDCIAVLLYNKNNAYLYHLSPLDCRAQKDIEKLKQALQDSISNLGKDCRAFLYGGIRGASDNLYENISEVLKKNNVKKQEAVYGLDNRTSHSIYFDVEKGIILSDFIYPYQSKQQLEENFEKVNIDNYFYSELN